MTDKRIYQYPQQEHLDCHFNDIREYERSNDLHEILQQRSPKNMLLLQLQQSNHKLVEITRQKDNLSGTCQGQFDHIAELTAKTEDLHMQLLQEQAHSADAQRQVETLRNELEAANAENRRLEERLRSQENDKKPEPQTNQLQQLTSELHKTREAWKKDQREARDLQLGLSSHLDDQSIAFEKVSGQLKQQRNHLETLQKEKENDQRQIEVLEQRLHQSHDRLAEQIEQTHQTEQLWRS